MTAADPRAHSALTASGASLAVACGLAFLPTMFERYLGSVPRIVFVALVLATALLLHWVFLGIAAHGAFGARLGEPGGAAVRDRRRGGAVLLGWLSGDSDAASGAAGARQRPGSIRP